MKILTSLALVLILSPLALSASSPFLVTEESLDGWISEIDLGFSRTRWIPSYNPHIEKVEDSWYSTIEFSCVSLTEKENEEFYSNLRDSFTQKGYTVTRSSRSRVDEKEVIRKFFFENDAYLIHLVFVRLGSREGTELVSGPRKSLDDYVVVQTIETK
jgi:hypothetical protein